MTAHPSTPTFPKGPLTPHLKRAAADDSLDLLNRLTRRCTRRKREYFRKLAEICMTNEHFIIAGVGIAIDPRQIKRPLLAFD